MTRAQKQVPGWVMIMLRFPSRGDGQVNASIQGPDAFYPFQRSQLTLNRITGEVVKWEPYDGNSTGRKLRTWMRALHTGEAFGFTERHGATRLYPRVDCDVDYKVPATDWIHGVLASLELETRAATSA
jgi:hypothetical protein